MDQDAGLMHRARQLGHIYESVQRVQGLVGEQIHNMNPVDSHIVEWLQAEELW